MTIQEELRLRELRAATRRHFLRDSIAGLGGLWFASQAAAGEDEMPLMAKTPPLKATAKRVIFMHMVGAPSQLDLFDYKPELERRDGQDCPAEFLEDNRFAFIQGVPQLLGSQFPFQRHGQSGQWVSDRLPFFSRCVDEVCFIKTMQTDQFNHGPAQLLAHTGDARMGKPSVGAWSTWGLGTENQNLPGFVSLISGGLPPRVGSALWGSGFLPSVHQGVQCRTQGDPIVNLTNPPGVTRELRREALNALRKLNQREYLEFGDPETLTRMAQYELAFRMQTEAPEAISIDGEPREVLELYGASPGTESFANNCLLARRLAERGVRFIQLFDWGWDSHGAAEGEALNRGFRDKCRQIDRPMAALLKDLKRRGLLDDTLVVWTGEFGRTPMRENRGGGEMRYVGRDHNPHAFTLWMAGGGARPGFSHGRTDDLGHAAVESPVHVRDFHATLLRLLGLDHQRLVYPYRGLEQRLTGVAPAQVIREVML